MMAKHLDFNSLRDTVSSHFSNLPDKRQNRKTNYEIHDPVMSGFACMYFQDPSMLQFQIQLQEEQNRNNLQTLFKVKKIPESTLIRTVIDDVESEHFRPIFKDLFTPLQRGKILNSYQIFPNLYLCSIDGSQYFSSEEINCEHCLTATHKDGRISYTHKVLQAAIMHPDKKQVIPLMPEEIRNTDGSKKQDCEVNAGKRLIKSLKKDHPRLGLIIVGDGLFSKQPFITDVLKEGMHYIFAVKPDDHKYLMDWVNAYDPGEIDRQEIVDSKGKTHVYEWVNNVPLNGGNNAINVNFFRYQQIVKDKAGKEKVVYKNSWVTDLEVDLKNVRKLVKGGRCRWKIENECFNTLKNQGYHIEHNYGHGEKNLCFNFYLLTLLAFYFHQIFELTCKIYQECRKKFGSKLAMWETLRSYIKILVFDDWEILLSFALTPTRYKPVFTSG